MIDSQVVAWLEDRLCRLASATGSYYRATKIVLFLADSLK